MAAVTAAVVPPSSAAAAGLRASDVERVIERAVAEAEAVGVPVAVVVVDREGNVLGGFRMEGVCADAAPCGGPTLRGGGGEGGLEGLTVPAVGGTSGAVLAAISKAGTAAFFSTGGNAFSTRSAAFIIQENFPPGVTDAPSGPLFGVQFSQLLCSDINPALPLGLSGDTGGLPLYRGRRALGGVGVESGRVYTADPRPSIDDVTAEERIAVAATRGLEAPAELRGDRIYVGGLRLPFQNVETARRRPRTPFASLRGVVEVAPRDSPPSRIQKARLGGVRGGVLLDAAGAERYPATHSVDPPVNEGGLPAGDVVKILGQAARQADRTRAGIRRPFGDRARVNISVVDLGGRVLGLFRTQDAPIFGIDVSVQKARSAAFFSAADAAERLRAAGAARVAGILQRDNLGEFVQDAAGDGVRLDGSIAFSNRAIGFLSRPFFPDGIHSTKHGPFSRPIQRFSIFNNGIQVELVLEVLTEILAGIQPVDGCTRVPGLQNGLQIFPGSVPLYRGRRLIGAIGVSGDGVDQDDIIAAAGSAGFEAPENMRADRTIVRRVRLPYVKFPRRPTIR